MLTKRKITVGLIILTLVLGLVWVQGALAFTNEPTGFRGHPWGTPIEDLSFKIKSLQSIPEIKVDIYGVVDVSPQDVKEMIFALDGKLAGMSGQLGTAEESKAMVMVMIQTFGPPTKRTDVSLIWEGETAYVEMLPNYGTFVIGSATGMHSVEALLEWHEANVKKQAI